MGDEGHLEVATYLPIHGGLFYDVAAGNCSGVDLMHELEEDRAVPDFIDGERLREHGSSRGAVAKGGINESRKSY